MNENDKYTLEELCALTDLSKRTVRYYIQQNLVDKPEGSTRGSYYLPRHLEQLLLIRKWQSAGISLERIRELLSDDEDMPPQPRPKPGSVRVQSLIFISEGVSLCIDPQISGLSPEQIRNFSQKLIELFSATINEEPQND